MLPFKRKVYQDQWYTLKITDAAMGEILSIYHILDTSHSDVKLIEIKNLWTICHYEIKLTIWQSFCSIKGWCTLVYIIDWNKGCNVA